MNLKFLKNINPMHMLTVLGSGFVILLLLLFVLLNKTEKPAGQQSGSVRQTIPQAEPSSDATKVESYRNGSNINDYWNSCDEQQNAPSAPCDNNTATGSRQTPQAPTIDELFRDSSPQPSSGSAPVHKSTPPAKAQEQPKEEPVPESPAPEAKPLVKRSGAVSSLDDASSDIGSGFSTLDGADTYISQDEGKPYSCMFTRDEKVKSGQRITLRLLEDLVISGVHIPRNTHLQGVCTISERMEINVTSLDMGGRILKFHFEAFDTDGGKGIYCSDLSKTAKEAADQSINTVTSSLNGRLGRVARDAATLGASIIRSKTGEVSVSIPAGYTFYLVEKTR